MSHAAEPTITRLLSELHEGLCHLYDQRLRGLYLFGSCARGEQDDESDVDVIIVLDELVSYSAEIDRTSFLISDISLKYDLSSSFLSPVGKVPRIFYQNVRREAIPA